MKYTTRPQAILLLADGTIFTENQSEFQELLTEKFVSIPE